MTPKEEDKIIDLIQEFRFIKQNQLDVGLTRDEKLELVKMFKLKKFKAGQRIF